MKLLTMISAFILAAPVASLATAQDAEVARCKALKEIRLEQSKWAYDYWKFKKDATVTSEGRYNVSYRGAQKIVRMIEEMRSLSGQTGKDALLSDAHKLFDAIENNEITKQRAQNLLTSGLENLREKMDDVTYRAEAQTGCQIIPRSPGFNPNANSTHVDPPKAGNQ